MEAATKQHRRGNNPKPGPFLQRKRNSAPHAETPFISPKHTERIRPKLNISQPGDEYEQEADRAADQVMRMSDESVSPPMISRLHSDENSLQRMCPECENEILRNTAHQVHEYLTLGTPVSTEIIAQRKSDSDLNSIANSKAKIQKKCTVCESGGEPCPKVMRMPENEPLQGNFASAQRKSEASTLHQGDVGQPENRTGMPGALKAGLEALSGMDLSGVQVHNNSSKPAQLNALAYTQEQDIHVGPGQEKHLPHEGWHAVQQMQGRVKPTMQTNGVSINDDEELEREADVMGPKALQMTRAELAMTGSAHQRSTSLQRVVQTERESGAPGEATRQSSRVDKIMRSFSKSEHIDTRSIDDTADVEDLDQVGITYFPTKQWTLDSNDIDVLQSLPKAWAPLVSRALKGKSWKTLYIYILLIGGHDPRRSDRPSNYVLAHERAKTVAYYLTDLLKSYAGGGGAKETGGTMPTSTDIATSSLGAITATINDYPVTSSAFDARAREIAINRGHLLTKRRNPRRIEIWADYIASTTHSIKDYEASSVQDQLQRSTVIYATQFVHYADVRKAVDANVEVNKTYFMDYAPILSPFDPGAPVTEWYEENMSVVEKETAEKLDKKIKMTKASIRKRHSKAFELIIEPEERSITKVISDLKFEGAEQQGYVILVEHSHYLMYQGKARIVYTLKFQSPL